MTEAVPTPSGHWVFHEIQANVTGTLVPQAF